ncbi:MAG: hypothetical protein HY401_08660 [Elusimicrobia bacterium]|nr:hypothetical protein [Elusimicrobiota bacterium]
MNSLLLARWRMFRNWARSAMESRWEIIKVVSVVLFGFLLVGCLHWWFYRALSYISGVTAIGNLLMKKLFEIAFLSSFFLIALSAMVTSLSTHFGAKDLSLLISWPIKSLVIYLGKAKEAALHASWMVALVLVPFLAVLMKLKGQDAGFMLAALLLFVPFAICAASAGIAMASLFVSLFPRQKLKELLGVLGVLIFVMLYAGIRLTLPQKLMRPDELEDVLEYLAYLESPAASFLPSRWYVEAMNAYIAHDWERMFQAMGIVGLFAAGGLALLIFMGTKILTRRRWARVLEGGCDPGETIAETGGEKESCSPAPLSLRRIFILKEIKFFLRDSQRFSNVSFILAVGAIYLVSIYRLPMDTPHLKNFMSFINLALGLFIIAALSLRFCFPQPSLELQYAWIVKTSPVRAEELLGAKLLFSVIFLNVIGGILVCVSPLLLGTDPALIPIYLAASIFCSSVLPAMALGIGSAFPKTRFENIIQIETSFGGFLYAVCALIFVVITLSVFAWPIQYFFKIRYFHRSMDGADWAWISVLGAGYLTISLAAASFGWWLAKRSWKAFAV